MKVGCTQTVVLLIVALASAFGLAACPARAEAIFHEDFESPVVSGYVKGAIPDNGHWVSASQGYRSDYHGLCNKDSNDFTAPEGNDQAIAFRYTNSGLTTSEGAVGVFESYVKYTVSCNVATDLGSINGETGTSYGVQLIAFAAGVARNDCRSTPAASYLLVNKTGHAALNDMSEVVTFTYTPLPGDASVGMDIGIRLKGATTSAMVDNVQVDRDASNVPRLTLRVDPVTGDVSIRGDTNYAVPINYYEVASEGDSLDADNWSSLADQDFDGGGAPSGLGDGWEEAGGSGKHGLAEAFLLGGSDIGTSQSVDLGSCYDPAVDAKDLLFTYSTTYGEIKEGLVEYVTSARPGDANLDDVVDAADYVALKKGLGTGPGASYGDGDFDLDGDVDWADLAILRSNLMLAGGGMVPEPGSILLLAGAAAALAARRRKTNAKHI